MPGERPPARRIVSSSYHITISTNQRYRTQEAITLDMRPLYESLKEIFGTPEGVIEVVEILEEGKDPHAVIGDTEADIGLEYSEKSGLHAHVLLTVTHATRIRMNLPALKRKLKLTMEANGASNINPYFHVRWVPDQLGVVRNYVYKMVDGEDFQAREGTRWNRPFGCKCECNIGNMSGFFS